MKVTIDEWASVDKINRRIYEKEKNQDMENKMKKTNMHSSDCAIYNEPAYPKGDCDCEFDSSDKTDENILSIKEHYIGGELSFKNKDGLQRTEIKDIILKKVERTLCLTIMGKDFNYGFHLPDITFRKMPNTLIIGGRHGTGCEISKHPTMSAAVSIIEMIEYSAERAGYRRGYRKGYKDKGEDE